MGELREVVMWGWGGGEMVCVGGHLDHVRVGLG